MSDKLKELQDEARDLHARLGYISLQVESLSEERAKIRALLEVIDRKFAALQAQATVPASDS